MSQISEFQIKVDTFLKTLLPEVVPEKRYFSKVIHDCVWGTNTFFAWEIALIDSPLLQRLRRIHQTGLAFLVYPTATHTRFEHTLGVTTLVERLIINLNKNHEKELVNESERKYLRLAALLHDVGHSFLSHVSELVYERDANFQLFKEEISKEFGVTPKGHELMSFLMINSKVFQNYFSSIIEPTVRIDGKKELEFLINIDWGTISGFVIGYSKDKEKKYLADIINGPIDCDKLDYFSRDARFSGATIVYDVERYFYSVTTMETKGMKRLTLTLAGINVMEQLVISKMMMFSYVYHHHKVRASEALIKRLCFNIIKDKKTVGKKTIELEHPTDFLYYTDENILNSSYDHYNNSIESKEIIKSLLDRNLWVRAQMISCFNTDLTNIPIEILQLERDLHHPKNIAKLQYLKDKIIDTIKLKDPSSDISSQDIWIDIPFPPTADEPKQIKIKKSREINDLIELADIFPLEQWIDAYERSKLKGHVFCNLKYQKVVFNASREVFKVLYKVNIKDFTQDFLKVECN